jgi:hypothetical protein
MIYTENGVQSLQKLLDTISRMPQVPDLQTSASSNVAFEEWQKQWGEFNALEHEAEIIALCTVPTEVRKMLAQVRAKVRERQGLDDLVARKCS